MQSNSSGSDDRSAETLWNTVGAEWISEGYQRLWRQHSDRIAVALISQLIKGGNRSLLKTDLFDEAVGDGQVALLSSLAETVHGIDIAPNVVTEATRRNPGLKGRTGDICHLPYDDATFDVVVSLSTLDHFPDAADIDVALREIRRVMTAGGQLLLTLDNPLNPKIALRGVLSNDLLKRTGLVPYECGATMPRDALVAAVRRAGFRVLLTRPMLHCPRVLAVRAAALVEKLGKPAAEAALLATLDRFERLGTLPTRWRTGHYTALLAEAEDT